jgi:hypothetical protein
MRSEKLIKRKMKEFKAQLPAKQILKGKLIRIKKKQKNNSESAC